MLKVKTRNLRYCIYFAIESGCYVVHNIFYKMRVKISKSLALNSEQKLKIIFNAVLIQAALFDNDVFFYTYSKQRWLLLAILN